MVRFFVIFANIVSAISTATTVQLAVNKTGNGISQESATDLLASLPTIPHGEITVMDIIEVSEVEFARLYQKHTPGKTYSPNLIP